MSFTAALPLTGYAGWAFLKRTEAKQTAALAETAVVKRDEDYFRAKIGKVDSAEQLVADRRLLRVALGAFGLEGDINNKAFIQKVLESSTLKDGSLANRLADKQYQKLSAAFGFGNFSTPSTKLSDFPDKILKAWKTRQFEQAVGEQNEDMRLALNAEREMADLAAKTKTSNDAKWFAVMGNAPLRKVFEKALGLPSAFSQLDIDKQLEVLKDKAQSQLGTDQIADLSDPARMEGLLRRFLIRSEAEAYRSQFGGSAALTLMSQAVTLSRQRF
jgi:hypothetical protein